MLTLLMAGIALWLLIVIAVLGLCRAAARADQQEAARRVARTGRRGATVGLAAVVTATGLPGDAQAGRAACENRSVPYQRAPALVRAAIACEVDRVRVRNGLRWLRDNRRLTVAARRHSRDMVRRRYFSHYSPAGSSPADRARRTGYVRAGCSWTVGEVLAWGTARRSTAASTVRAWLRSPGHRSIILSRSYGDGGVGTRAGTPAGHASGVTVTMVVGRRSC